MRDLLEETEEESPGALTPAGEAGAAGALLYGAGAAARLVAVEFQDESAVLLTSGAGGTERTEVPFSPWLLSSDRKDLAGARWSELEGGGLRFRAEFATWRACESAASELRREGISVSRYISPARQFLMATGNTLFRGMRFDELRRMQFDLETSTLDPNDPEARILLIAVSDSTGFQVLVHDEDERRLIEQFIGCVAERDPDVLEGHNLFGFDLPYLAARAGFLGVPLTLGRDGSPIEFGRERNCALGPNVQPFRPCHVWGRHCIDTYLAVQRYDVGRGELDSYSLKECARAYGISEEDRVLLERARMSDLWAEDPDLVMRYALQDVCETRSLAGLVTPADFYQTQMVPDSYQDVATMGAGQKINLLMIRAYLHRGRAIPTPQHPRPFAGGYTEVCRTGLLRRVVKADVESLYPSLMLQEEIRPASDTLGIFLPMLRRLTQLRLQAKAAVRTCPASDGEYWNGLQLSFKILINSFYGYLGGPFSFNDYDAAERVTQAGQQVARQVAELLEASGSQVIEIDTDGVYFIPPEDVEGEKAEEAYVARIGSNLPAGLRLAFDGRYAAMISLKIKNYVLLDYDGRKVFKGGSLRSRADEKFGREFIVQAVDFLLSGDSGGVAALYTDLADRLMRGDVPVRHLARRERVTEKTLHSDSKRRSREAIGDTHVGESVRLYRRSNGSLARIEEYSDDEDRWYYIDRLRKFAARLEDALGEEFDRVCPRISRYRVEAHLAGQPSLFEF